MRAVVMLLALCGFAAAQEAPTLDRATQARLQSLTVDLSAAQKAGDAAAVRKLAKEAIKLLGDHAGVPETPDQFRPLAKEPKPLSADEIANGFDPYIGYIKRQKWWKKDLDPTKSNHAAREVATVIEGCLSARQVSKEKAGELLQMARDAGDYLVWSQEQAGTGVIPFPAVRNGTGRPFEVAEMFLRRAEKDGTVDKVIRHGWTVEDFEDGGLQFDNGLAGVALAHLHEATNGDRYRKAALRAADWAADRRVVTNWNYNSFSIILLAEAYRLSNDRKYLDAARKKATLGVLPGQLTKGPRAGRWADAHNARPAYHYIMVRHLAALAAVMPKDDADLPAIIDCLRIALLARNPDYRKGIINSDSSIEALVRVRMLPAHVADQLKDCQSIEALTALEASAAEAFRNNRPSMSPGAWGQLLAYRYTQLTRPEVPLPPQ